MGLGLGFPAGLSSLAIASSNTLYFVSMQVPGLIALGSKYFERGLRLLFFPCNQFCSEEPGTAADIAAFYVGEHGLPASSLAVSKTRWHMLRPAGSPEAA